MVSSKVAVLRKAASILRVEVRGHISVFEDGQGNG